MKNGFLVLFAFLLAFPLYAFDNPVRKYSVLSDFGPDMGIRFECSEVLATEEGEIIYYNDSLLMLYHGDNIRSVYSGIRPVIPADGNYHVKKGDKIGDTISGSFLFEIYDTEMDRYINPVLMTGGKNDRKSPAIKKLLLKNGAGGDITLVFNRNNIVEKGKAELVIEASEIPYRTCIILNGSRITDRKIRTLKPGEKVSSLKYMLELPEGISVVNVELYDFYGNKSCKNVVLEVK